jgi:pimeloyl-ACP methyl ester carboxylesterase
MEKIRCNDLNIQTAQWDGAGKTLLAVHGITANCMSWKTYASALTPEHKLIAVDLRGRGLSDKPSSGYSIDHHVQDIRCLLDRMELPEVIIIGHSLGAFIALVFAASYPQRTQGLILVDGGGSMPPEKWEKVAAAIKPTKDRLGKRYPSEDDYLQEMKNLSYYQPWNQAKTDCFRYELVKAEGYVCCGINPENIREEAANVRKIKPEEFYSNISCNTLILRATEGLTGNEDILLPEETITRMVESIPAARAFSVQGANHYSILFDPFNDRNEAIRKYLSNL